MGETMWLTMLLLTLSLAAGGVIGRRWAALVPFTVVAVFYLGLHTGWWGNGVGDAWYVPMIVGMVLGVSAALTTVAARRYVEQR